MSLTLSTLVSRSMAPTPSKPYDPSAGKQSTKVDPSQIARVEIFPPIGIARVGDSGTLPDGKPDPLSPEIEYFYGPEVPGLTDHPFGSFRDSQRRIKRQVRFQSLLIVSATMLRPVKAARFRVYAYDKQGKVLGEINSTHGYALTWKVHVANKKAANFLFHGRVSLLAMGHDCDSLKTIGQDDWINQTPTCGTRTSTQWYERIHASSSLLDID